MLRQVAHLRCVLGKKCITSGDSQENLAWVDIYIGFIKSWGVERPWWTINWVAWQRDHPKWTFGQRHRRALVHLEELESAESAERTLSGYDENVEALPYRCMWLCGETDYVSSYDMWWFPQLHVDRPGFSNPCRCQLCQTLGGINLTVDIEDSTKKIKSRMLMVVLIKYRSTFRLLYVLQWYHE